MGELALLHKSKQNAQSGPQVFFRQSQTLVGSVSDSVSGTVIRGSLTDNAEERSSCARMICSLGGSASSRIAFRKALRSAASEYVDIRPLANELSRIARGPVADAFMGAALDLLQNGDARLSRMAGDVGSALARNMSDTQLKTALQSALRLLNSPDNHVREAASRIVVSFCKHPSTDARHIAELAYDSGSAEGLDAAKKALMLPPKIIDMPSESTAAA